MKLPLSLVALVMASNTFAAALDNWHWRNPLPTSTQLRGVAFGGAQFTAVGDGGWIMTSTNGQEWVARSSGFQTSLNGVTYGNGEFVAYGYEETNGVFLNSTNGSTWNRSTSDYAGRLRAIAFAQGLYVGVGEATLDGPTIVTSTDGRNWTNQTSVPIVRALSGIAFGNGAFVAVGERGLILTSPDGFNWSESGSGTDRDLQGVAFDNRRFVVTGNRAGISIILTSTDGLNWVTEWSLNTVTAPEPLTSLNLTTVSFGQGFFVACGEGHAALTSPDGLTWTEHDLGRDRVLEGIAYGNGYHAAVGWATFTGGVITSAVVSSPDGGAWTDQTGGVPTVATRGLAFGNGRYVAVNYQGKVLTSSNGAIWSATAELGANANLLGAVYANGLFLAMGSGGTNGQLLVSADGLQWTNRAPAGTPVLLSAAYGNGRFIAPRGSTVLLSTNGFDWSKTNSSTATNLSSVLFNGGRFVGVGDRGTVQTSSNGLDWTAHSSGTNATLRSVAFGKGSYVAVGRGTIITSTNAIDWSIGQTDVWDLQCVAFGGGTFVAVGFKLSPYLRSFILTSEDGLLWTEQPVSGGVLLWSVIYDGRTFLIGGDSGTILQSDPLTDGLAPALAIRRTNGIKLILSGTAGATYRIEYRDELLPGIPWNPLTTILLTNGPVFFTDPQAQTASKRFYRAVLLP